MKVNETHTWLCVMLLAAIATPSLTRVEADDYNLLAEPPGGQPEIHINTTGGGAWAQPPGFTLFGNSGPRGANSPAAAIRKAAEAVRDAKDSQEKENAQKKLLEVLNKCYDEDMAQREKELKQIEERLAKLRELLERRRTKKQDIIDLQVKVALNEAEGLGFYEGERPGKTAAKDFSLAPKIIAVPPQVPVPVAAPVPTKATPR